MPLCWCLFPMRGKNVVDSLVALSHSDPVGHASEHPGQAPVRAREYANEGLSTLESRTSTNVGRQMNGKGVLRRCGGPGCRMAERGSQAWRLRVSAQSASARRADEESRVHAPRAAPPAMYRTPLQVRKVSLDPWREQSPLEHLLVARVEDGACRDGRDGGSKTTECGRDSTARTSEGPARGVPRSVEPRSRGAHSWRSTHAGKYSGVAAYSRAAYTVIGEEDRKAGEAWAKGGRRVAGEGEQGASVSLRGQGGVEGGV